MPRMRREDPFDEATITAAHLSDLVLGYHFSFLGEGFGEPMDQRALRRAWRLLEKDLMPIWRQHAPPGTLPYAAWIARHPGAPYPRDPDTSQQQALALRAIWDWWREKPGARDGGSAL